MIQMIYWDIPYWFTVTLCLILVISNIGLMFLEFVQIRMIDYKKYFKDGFNVLDLLVQTFQIVFALVRIFTRDNHRHKWQSRYYNDGDDLISGYDIYLSKDQQFNYDFRQNYEGVWIVFIIVLTMGVLGESMKFLKIYGAYS